MIERPARQADRELPPPAVGAEGAQPLPAVASHGRLLGLAACATGLLAGACFYALVLPLTPGRMVRPSAALIPDLELWSLAASLGSRISWGPGAAALAVGGFALIAFASYAVAVALTWNREPDRRSVALVTAAAVLAFAISALALPNQNTDIYQYIARARVAAVHGANPHYVPSDAFPDDPVYPYASHRFTGIVGDKLALWTLLSIPLAKVAGDDPTTNLLVFRSLFLLFNLGSLALIAFILWRIDRRYLVAGLALYSWNPIVSVLGQSKTDTTMVFFLLGAVALLTAERPRWAIVSLAGSVLIKLIPLPLVAAYWIRELRLRRWRELVLSVALFAVTVVVLYAPFWDGPSLVRSHMGVAGGEAGVSAGASLRSLILPGFVLLTVAVGALQGKDCRGLIRGWTLLMLAFALFLARFSNAWYLMTFIAMVALCADWRIVCVSTATAFSSFLFYTWYSTSTADFPLPDLFSFSRIHVYLAPALLTGIAIGVMAAWQRLRSPRPLMSR